MKKWSFNKTQKKEFAGKMAEIERFCENNKISKSFNSDSYYFTLDGKKYRVSNHTIEASNAKAFDDDGTKWRNFYHTKEEEERTICILASKTRLIEIYNNLKDGKTLDKRGRVVEVEK